MTYNKRSKMSRRRGSWTHGYGEKKKHRGAGSRGGRGNAGSGKRADVKKPTFQNEGRRFGRHGFINPMGSTLRAINVSYLDMASLEGKPGIEITKDAVKVDLDKLGFDKLLGAGKVSGKYQITARTATASAIAKIEAAGGSVTVLKAPEAPEKKGKKSDAKQQQSAKDDDQEAQVAQDDAE